jgi:hypothetical protein
MQIKLLTKITELIQEIAWSMVKEISMMFNSLKLQPHFLDEIIA